MAGGPAPAPRERGWTRVLLALAAFLLVPLVPQLRAALPVEQLWLLLVPALTVCLLVGWLAGGRWTLALGWLGGALLLAWWVRRGTPAGGSQAYGDLALAWGLLVAGLFGSVCVVAREQRFFRRALSAIGLSVLLGMMLAAAGRMSLGRAQAIFGDEFVVRNTMSATAVRQSARQWPELARLLDDTPALLERTSALAARAYPALLALEGLAALALAWALYHRLSRTRLGPPLAPLRAFSFDDHLIWGLIAGLVLALAPSLAALQPVGVNLLVFFAALYGLRGLAVVVAVLARRGAALAAVAALAALLFLPVALPTLFGLGVADTWFDWRRRPGAA